MMYVQVVCGFRDIVIIQFEYVLDMFLVYVVCGYWVFWWFWFVIGMCEKCFDDVICIGWFGQIINSIGFYGGDSCCDIVVFGEYDYVIIWM